MPGYFPKGLVHAWVCVGVYMCSCVCVFIMYAYMCVWGYTTVFPRQPRLSVFERELELSHKELQNPSQFSTLALLL